MKPNDLSGKSVVLAGSFPGRTHAAIKKQLATLGATVSGAVSASTHVVFVGKKGGAKEAKARQLGLEYERRHTGYGELHDGLQVAMGKPRAAAPGLDEERRN